MRNWQFQLQHLTDDQREKLKALSEEIVRTQGFVELMREAITAGVVYGIEEVKRRVEAGEFDADIKRALSALKGVQEE